MQRTRTMDQLVERACQHWERRHRAEIAEAGESLPGGRAFTITLAREAGTQGTAVAHEVGKRLGWNVYDHELLERIAQDKGLRTDLLESVDERHSGWIKECVRE